MYISFLNTLLFSSVCMVIDGDRHYKTNGYIMHAFLNHISLFTDSQCVVVGEACLFLMDPVCLQVFRFIFVLVASK